MLLSIALSSFIIFILPEDDKIISLVTKGVEKGRRNSRIFKEIFQKIYVIFQEFPRYSRISKKFKDIQKYLKDSRIF